PRWTPLPPFSLPNHFYRIQALLCPSLDLLFFITVGQPLPSSLAATPPSAAPAPCFLYRCSRRNLLLGRALLCHRGHLCSSPPLLTTPLPPLLSLLPSLPQSLSNAPLPLHLLTATVAPPYCHRCRNNRCPFLSPPPFATTTAPTSLTSFSIFR
ncbi:hypothetical protein BHE74_00044663, partial [Ensete ventricosum]